MDDSSLNDEDCKDIFPSHNELMEAKTARAKGALHTFYKHARAVQRFRTKYGHANIPQKYDGDPGLGIWVNKMREMRKRYDIGEESCLSERKIKVLEMVGFTWAKPRGQASWEANFKRLKAFIKEHGHANVPTKDKSWKTLGRWVSTQRAVNKDFQAGREVSPEIRERLIRLSSVGFSWQLGPRKEIGSTEGSTPTSTSSSFQDVGLNKSTKKKSESSYQPPISNIHIPKVGLNDVSLKPLCDDERQAAEVLSLLNKPIT